MQPLKNREQRKGHGPARFLSVLGLAAAASACGRVPSPPPASPPPADRVWNWLDFPRADHLTLARASAVIEPAQVALLKAPREGWFELAPALQGLRDKNGPVAANQNLGQMAPGTEVLEEEGEALRRQLTDVETQLRHVREEEAVETFLEQERKARQDIATYEAALELAKDPALRRDLLPEADAASREEINRLKERLQAAKLRLDENQRAGEKQAALQTRKAELEEAKAAFERRQKSERDRIRAPFAGQVRFVPVFEKKPADAPSAGGKPQVSTAPDASTAPAAPVWRAYLRAEAPIAVLRDDSAFWAKVEVADAAILSVPAHQLLFTFVSGSDTLAATFDGRAPETSGGALRMTPVYRFGITAGGPDLRRLAGGEVSGRLVQKLPQPAYVVSKMRLLAYRSDAFADGQWAANCARVFPGCQVLAVGREEVALVPPPAPGETPPPVPAAPRTPAEAAN